MKSVFSYLSEGQLSNTPEPPTCTTLANPSVRRAPPWRTRASDVRHLGEPELPTCATLSMYQCLHKICALSSQLHMLSFDIFHSFENFECTCVGKFSVLTKTLNFWKTRKNINFQHWSLNEDEDVLPPPASRILSNTQCDTTTRNIETIPNKLHQLLPISPARIQMDV